MTPQERKLKEFLRRNNKYNAHLYEDGKVEGVDYLICPESKARLTQISKAYITKTLGMTVEEYDAKYPNIKKCSDARINNIKAGVNQIDPETGLTKHKIARIKAIDTLKAVDENGVSGYQKLGQKTRATHMSKVDEHGRNGYKRQAHARITTVLENGLTVEQNAHIKQKETLIRNGKSHAGGASMLSILALKPILSLLKHHNIDFYFDKSEYCIKDEDTGNYYFYDLTNPSLKIAIEYQSNSWHANPFLGEDDWNKWSPPMGEKKTPEAVLECQ